MFSFNLPRVLEVDLPKLLLGDLTASLNSFGVGVVTVVENDGDILSGQEEGNDHVRPNVA